MKVSVIIPNYNYANYVVDTIDSVYGQTHKDIECIVVNDGSTDNSLEVLQNLKNSKYHDLVIVNKENGGLSSARNAGIVKATGDYIAFLDSDDLWTSNKLENQLKVFSETGADVVFSNYIYFEGDHFFEHNDGPIGRPDMIDFIEKNAAVGSSSSVLIKSEVVKKIGFFDANLRSLEDIDYWFRCAYENYKFVFCNHTDIHCRVHPANRMSDNSLRMIAYHLIVFYMHMAKLELKQLNKEQKQRLKKAVAARLGRIRWYADRAKNREYFLFTILLGIKYIGIRYVFSRYILTRSVKYLYYLAVKK